MIENIMFTENNDNGSNSNDKKTGKKRIIFEIPCHVKIEIKPLQQ